MFVNETATTEIYPLSLHDALPISTCLSRRKRLLHLSSRGDRGRQASRAPPQSPDHTVFAERTQFEPCLSRRKRLLDRSEEHTSELQSQSNLVCRLLLEKKNISKPT